MFINYLKKTFFLETKSLAIMRIALGFMIIFYLGDYRLNIDWIFSNDGIINAQITWSKWYRSNIWQFHSLSDKSFYIGFLFILHLCISISFLIGYKTKYSTILLRLFTISLHSANPLVLNSFDTFLGIMLLRCCFLPLGEYGSIDQYSQYKNIGVNKRILSFATIGFIFSLCFLYIDASFSRRELWMGSEYIFWENIKMYSLGSLLGNYVDIFYEFSGLSRIILIFEFFFPFLFCIHWNQKIIRRILAILMILFHFGIFFFLEIGMFPLGMIIIWLGTWIHNDYSQYTLKFGNTLSLFILLYIFLWNINFTFPFIKDNFNILPSGLHKYGNILSLNRSRKMFGGKPTSASRIKISGVYQTGLLYDPILNLPFDSGYVNYDTPFIGEKRRKLFQNTHQDFVKESIGLYFCKKNPSLKKVDIRQFRREILTKEKLLGPLHQRLLFTKKCY